MSSEKEWSLELEWWEYALVVGALAVFTAAVVYVLANV